MAPPNRFPQWLQRISPGGPKGNHIFCFHHAGGSASVFNDWRGRLKECRCTAIQLPGRESRFRERHFPDWTGLIYHIGEAILADVDTDDFSLFGHSMGALLSFEVARYLQARSLIPRYIFVSGCPPPDCRRASLLKADLDDESMGRVLKILGGTNESVLSDRGMREFFFPILRNDLLLLERYQFVPGLPLSTRMVALSGYDDEEASPSIMTGWSYHAKEFQLRCFSGGHFFPFGTNSTVASVVGEILRQSCESGHDAHSAIPYDR